jgi:hypothetical protein
MFSFPQRFICFGRFLGQNFSDFENAGHGGPNQDARPKSLVNSPPAETEAKVEPVTSEQTDQNLLVETHFLARLEGLRR